MGRPYGVIATGHVGPTTDATALRADPYFCVVGPPTPLVGRSGGGGGGGGAFGGGGGCGRDGWGGRSGVVGRGGGRRSRIAISNVKAVPRSAICDHGVEWYLLAIRRIAAIVSTKAAARATSGNLKPGRSTR